VTKARRHDGRGRDCARVVKADQADTITQRESRYKQQAGSKPRSPSRVYELAGNDAGSYLTRLL